jgi:ABC-2 type transport system permease protein
MLMTPMRRSSLLIGLMIADLVLVLALTLPVLALGFAVGVRFQTGILGVLLFALLAGLWGLVFTGFPYAIALKTGSPGAVGASFLLFFPFAFLTTATLPQEALTGWLEAIAVFNPMTYLLAALRSLLYGGWKARPLVEGFLAVAGVGLVSMTLAFATLRGRVARG